MMAVMGLSLESSPDLTSSLQEKQSDQEGSSGEALRGLGSGQDVKGKMKAPRMSIGAQATGSVALWLYPQDSSPVGLASSSPLNLHPFSWRLRLNTKARWKP